MKKDLLFVISYTSLPNELGNSRFLEIINMLNSNLYNIEIIYSSFHHSSKKQRNKIKFNSTCKYTMLYEPTYFKNISLKRVYAEKVFSLNVRKYLNKRNKPDLIYCGIPILDVGYECANYAKRNKVPFFIDIQDLWPEAFKMIFNLKYINNILFLPLERKANYIYKQANRIIAVSDTYKNRALSVNKKDGKGLTVYLGTNAQNVYNSLKNMEPKIKKNKNEFWIGYLGTLGKSYDIRNVLNAIKKINSKCTEMKFIVLGDGPQINDLKALANSLKINALFLGRLDYMNAMAILKQCDIAINPIVKGSAGSVINKVMDYAVLGIPVINSQESEEYRDLVEKYHAGINVECENANEIANAIVRLYSNSEERNYFGQGNKDLGMALFNRETTYLQIKNTIEEQLKKDEIF